MNQPTKDVEIGGQRYQVGRLRASVGSYLIGIMTTKMRAAAAELTNLPASPRTDAPEPTAEERSLGQATFILSRLTLAESDEVFALCMARCGWYQNVGGKDVLMPIMDGTIWVAAELEYDAVTTLQLVRECVAFNLSPFFSEPA